MTCTFEVGYCTVTFCKHSPREQSVVGPNPTQGKFFFPLKRVVLGAVELSAVALP